jgi:RHS repeat-associated protein
MTQTNQNVNQVNGYDPAGDVTYDGANNYLYDGEGRLCAVQTGGNGGPATGYLYNAEGTRVVKGSMSSFSACPNSASSFSAVQAQYLLDQSGDQVTELNGAGTWVHSNIWAAGTLDATYDMYGLHFHLSDWLGTRRMQTAAGGSWEQQYQSLPFGDGYTILRSTTADDATEHHFTGKERDTESGNDYFLARYFTSSFGRFMSPDWSAKVTPVPYAKLDNPQSLNLYGYVLNNPLSRADVDGHCDAPSNLKAGQVGICVASYISSSTFDVVGDGDNRGTNGNGGTSRIETTFTIDPTGGQTEKPKDGDKVAQSTVLGMKKGLQGTGSSQVSPGATVDKNGDMHISVNQSAHSEFDVGGTLGDISNHLKLEVTPDGKVGVDAGSTARQFPSLEIYRYTTDGTTVTTTLVHNYQEASPSALRQAEQPLAPVAPQ